ncbi:MAG: polyphosphate kinase 1 [Treponema sp.]|nr:polyphosphate kinase 1 [Treponema sp.]
MDTNNANDGNAPFFNRELSWLDFNGRVLEEGLDANRSPLERFKFLAIAASNFDEFFMVRVAAIMRAKKAGGGKDASGLMPAELLRMISAKVHAMKQRLSEAFVNEVFPSLAKGGLTLLRRENWTDEQRAYLDSLFEREIFPLLTPLRLGTLPQETASGSDAAAASKDAAKIEGGEFATAGENFGAYFEDESSAPSIENYTLHVAFLLEPEEAGETFGRGGRQNLLFQESPRQRHISIVRIPPALDRIIWLPEPGFWVLLEDLVQSFAAYLYPGYKVKESLVFKINRDADFSVDEKRDEDFIMAMEEVLEGRERSMLIRLVYSQGSEKIRNYLARRLALDDDGLYEVAHPLNPVKLYDLIQGRGYEHLGEKPWKIYPHPVLNDEQPLWDSIRASDIILHLPYQSFDPVIRFFQEAAADPQVAAIKTTLYRTSGDSPIIRALEQASLSGKHVTAVVELKARFDEGQNISWANRLEKAGVIVVYGLAHLKIHAKATIVMRREYDRIKRYVHLSTGNYNERTARFYEDIALFSAREDVAYDTGLLFNMITGYSAVQTMGKLTIAPTALKRRILDLIARESDRSSPEAPGKIMAKMNALADPEIIWALYRASQKGVNVLLNVRGICMLTPGVKGLSENIRVVSVIDRYLEHSRVYYFANGGSEELYLASADWMTRNLERRVELMFPVLQDDTRKTVLEILSAYFRDNRQAWLLDSRGAWTRLTQAAGEEVFRAQEYFQSRAAKAHAELQTGAGRGEFIVRRSTPVDPVDTDTNRPYAP